MRNRARNAALYYGMGAVRILTANTIGIRRMTMRKKTTVNEPSEQRG